MRAQSSLSHDRAFGKPYWGYEDIGIFFIILVLLTPLFRLLVRLQVLRRTDLSNPSAGLQFGLIAFLIVALYSVLKLRHQQPVLRPLGWVRPSLPYTVAALLLGLSFAFAVTLHLRFRNQSTPQVPTVELLLLGIVLGPILEESFFRGCLLPVLAQSIGSIAAIMTTAILFALFHGPVDLAHWISFTAIGIAYGWLRVASRSTTAAALMHATYNLALFLQAARLRQSELAECEPQTIHLVENQVLPEALGIRTSPKEGTHFAGTRCSDGISARGRTSRPIAPGQAGSMCGSRIFSWSRQRVPPLPCRRARLKKLTSCCTSSRLTTFPRSTGSTTGSGGTTCSPASRASLKCGSTT